MNVPEKRKCAFWIVTRVDTNNVHSMDYRSISSFALAAALLVLAHKASGHVNPENKDRPDARLPAPSNHVQPTTDDARARVTATLQRTKEEIAALYKKLQRQQPTQYDVESNFAPLSNATQDTADKKSLALLQQKQSQLEAFLMAQ